MYSSNRACMYRVHACTVVRVHFDFDGEICLVTNFEGNVEERRFFFFNQWRNRFEEGERREKRGRRRNAQGVEQKFESWLLGAKLR